jgi:hypothetical protein
MTLKIHAAAFAAVAHADRVHELAESVELLFAVSATSADPVSLSLNNS